MCQKVNQACHINNKKLNIQLNLQMYLFEIGHLKMKNLT